MNAADRAARDKEALELRRAGASPARIMENLGFRNLRQLEDAIARAMKASGVTSDPVSVRDLELERLDRLQQAVWLKAVKGDLGALDRVLALSDRRIKWAGVSQEPGRMRQALAEVLSALKIKPAHALHVAACESVCDQVDQARASGDQLATTKALYLIPHMMNVLERLGVPPAELAALAGAAEPDPDAAAGGPTSLQAFKNRRGIA